MKFYVFNFSDKYDILMGTDMIEQIEALIDLRERKLILPENELLIFHMSDDNLLNIKDLCKTYSDLFTEDVTNSATTSIRHKITLINEEPIYQRPFRLPQTQQQEVDSQIRKLLDENIIRPSESPWSSPVHLVPKKMDQSGVKKWRMVIDYRRLNEGTKSDKFPLPNIEELFSKLQGNNYFTTLDLTSGYHQILMENHSIEKTAFSTPNGHYEFLRMPFGLKNAPATFQRMMNNVLRNEISHNICLVYLDDIIVYSKSEQDHINKLQQVFEALRKVNLKLNQNKCVFMKEEIEFLGHILNKDGLKPNQSKIEVIQKFPIPKTLKQVRGFLGLIGYYRKFVPNLSKIIKPLTEVTKKNAIIDITDKKYIEAFEKCKHLLSNTPILAFPDFDKTFVITTDASDIALGALLSQENHPIAYASRTLSITEQKYNTTEKELLGILWAVTHFRPYIYGRKFILRTDHKALIWLSKLKEPNQRLTRWKLKLQDYDYKIEHVKGKENYVADALSRIQLHHTSEDSLAVQHDDDNRSLNTTPVNTDTNSWVSDKDNRSLNNTIHSCQENSDGGIPIINSYPPKRLRRVVFEVAPYKKANYERGMWYFYIPPNNEEQIIKEFMLEYLSKDKYAFIIPNEELYYKVTEVYRKYFDHNKFKPVRYTRNLIEIDDKEEQLTLIREYHLFEHRHAGIESVYKQLRDKYYWENMRKQIKKYILNCETCKKEKYNRHPNVSLSLETETPYEPMDIWHIDFMSLEGQWYLTVIDKFSKYAIVKPSEKSRVYDTIAEIFALIGTPNKIIHDGEQSMCSIIMQELFKTYNIKDYTTTPQHHKSNSDVERLHNTIQELYRLQRDSDLEKNQKINLITHSYNNTVHSSINMTPFEVHFGRKAKLRSFDNLKVVIQNYTAQQREFSKSLNKNVHELLKRGKEVRNERINRKIKTPKIYKVGNVAYLKNSMADRHKTKPRFLGPFTIVSVEPHNKYKLSNGRSYHVEELNIVPDSSSSSQLSSSEN
ncbi:unnamed protein product [Pieris macdunnoughi]|uniref:RNA-directed DNA polymerase n=1 Tax=Pieris macdunnoughi TaxID=345717 RepID=A0A821VEI2_9NEOP|nr:unnamed protein product [Pieris macdunnoughi]